MNILFKLLFIAINFNQVSNQLGNQCCSETKVHDVVWPENGLSENYTVSEPLCLDNMKMIVTRKCTETGWKPADNEIGCNSHQDQFKFDAYCPRGYIEILDTRICILILKQHVWSTDCVHQYGSVADVRQLIRTKPKIVKFLKEQDISKFWLPAKRDNNTEFLMWKLPPPLWNKHIEYQLNDAIPIDNIGNCLSMNVELYESLENCESELPLICLFDRNTESIVMKSFCDDSSVSARLKNYRDTCFNVKQIADLEDTGTLTLIDTQDAYFVVQSVIREFNIKKSPVLVDLIPGQGGYFNLFDWSKSIDDLNFIDWDPRLNRTQIFNTSIDLHTVVWNEKWNLVESDLIEYVILEDKNHLDVFPNITIYYNSTYDGLDVHIESMVGLWRTDDGALTCFSNGNALQPILKFDKIERIGAAWKLHLPYFKGNAHYWCEGVTLNGFMVVKSNVVEVQRNMYNNEVIFSVLIELPCIVCQFYVELNEIQHFIKNLTKVVEDEVIWQIKKIVEFKPNSSSMTVLFHGILQNALFYNKTEAKDVIQNTVSHILDEMSNSAKVIYVRDINICFSSDPDFPNTFIGHPSVYQIPCALENSLPPIQHCAGNLIEGAYWENTYNQTNLECAEISPVNSLIQLINGKLTAMLDLIRESTTDEHFDTPTNVHYTTQTLQSIMHAPDTIIFDLKPNSTLLETPIDTVFDVIDLVINQNQSVLQKAQIEMNTTNIMLETIDETTRKYSTSKSFEPDIDGTFLKIQRNLIVMISNPLIKNVTGIAIYKKTSHQGDESFYNYSIRKLFGNETYADIYNDTLEIGVNIPFKTLTRITKIRNGEPVPIDRIIIKIFCRDSFFQETQASGATEILKANSKIIGITIPEYQDDHLPSGIFMILKKEMYDINSTGYGCSDWVMGSTTSGWNKNVEHFKMVNKDGVLCQVTRLRNYGFVKLLGNNLVQTYDNDERDVIFIITIVGCILSLFGIFVIFMTAILIKAWRQREATPLILNICTATGLQLICYLLSETKIFHRDVQCLIIGGSLHYVTIVGFFLSLFVSNLQFRRYVIIIGPSTPTHFKIRLLIFGWVVPLLIVLICIFVNPEAYTPNEKYLDLGGICYPSDGVLLYAVHIPVMLIFCINLSIYVWVIINLNMEDKNLRKSPTRSNISKQIFLFAYAFFLLSLTWIFGILAHFLNINVFSYLFVITGTLQGFFIFLFCIIFDSSIQQVLKKASL